MDRRRRKHLYSQNVIMLAEIQNKCREIMQRKFILKM